MTDVLHWRKTTWILLLWGGYVPTWAVITGSSPAIVALWWLAGALVFGVLWLGTSRLSDRAVARAMRVETEQAAGSIGSRRAL